MKLACLAVVAVLVLSSPVHIAWASTPEGPAGASANSPPTAEISEPRNGAVIIKGTPTTFDGSNSSDPDNDILRFKWQFGDGGEANAAKTTHAYTETGFKIVNLTVSDNEAQDVATIVVNVVPVPSPNNINVPPKAAIDTNKTGFTREPIYFTSLATDSNGDNLTYCWDFGEDRFVYYLQPDATGKTVSHAYNDSGNYTVTHWVQETDTTERYVSAPVTAWANISALPVYPPLADAGPNINGVVNTEVTLNGAGASQNPGGRITTFEWDFDNDGVFDWSSNTTGKAKHVYTVVRSYIARLKVTDDRGGTAEDLTNVTITAPPNKPPFASAGNDQTAFVGQVVTLHGTASDEDGRIVMFRWDFDGDGAWDYENPSSGMGTWAYKSPGTYEARFQATDDRGDTAEDSALVNVLVNQPPTADAGGDQSVDAGETVLFDGSGSRDPEGGLLKFSWDFDDRDGLQGDASGPVADHVYTRGGDFTVTLTVTDEMGQSSRDTVLVLVTQAAGVSLAANPRARSLRPNEEGVFTLTVTNTGNGRDEFDLFLSGDNYRWASLDSPVVTLDAGASVQVTLRVTPPVDAAASAQAKITVRAVSDLDQNVQGQYLVTVTVLQSFGPSITVSATRQRVEAGRSSSFTIQVGNGGNGDDTVTLAASGAAGKWVSFSPAQVVVPRGTTKTVTVRLSVPAGTAAQEYLLTLTAVSGDNTTQDSTGVTVRVTAPPATVPGFAAVAFLASAAAACAVVAFRRRGSGG
ncbi:MAG: PKD domain-containing protein [Euryarchaeota archaeon]|nr:PKD domain-containing protein [Euryarchaeota archaeon]